SPAVGWAPIAPEGRPEPPPSHASTIPGTGPALTGLIFAPGPLARAAIGTVTASTPAKASLNARTSELLQCTGLAPPSDNRSTATLGPAGTPIRLSRRDGRYSSGGGMRAVAVAPVLWPHQLRRPNLLLPQRRCQRHAPRRRWRRSPPRYRPRAGRR